MPEQLGLHSIQAALQQLQKEIHTLQAAGVLPKINDDIFNIRAKHVQSKINTLNDKFVETVEEGKGLIYSCVKAMEFVEEHCHEYAQYLDVSVTGSFKQELVQLLLKDTLRLEFDPSQIVDVISYIVKASNRELSINQNKEVVGKPEESQLVLHRQKSDHGRKLRKFVFGSRNKC
jgi:hypothetical protein